MEIKVLLSRVLVFALNIIYLPIKIAPVRNRIVLISRESNEPSCDFICVKNAIESENSNIEVKILCRKLEKSITGVIVYFFHVINQMYQLSISKVAVLDTYCIAASVLHHKKSLKIVQIWHSSAAIKKFGHQTLDKESGSKSGIAKALRMHKNYDFFTAPGAITAELFAEGFDTDVSKAKIICLPRLKCIKDGSLSDTEEIKKEYPCVINKQNILYAPTFRKGRQIKVAELIENIDTERCNLIIKLHPLDKERLNISQRLGVIVDDKYDTYKWFNVVDKVISDYSAVGLEAMVADKEVYFYLYDLADYKYSTGLNIDFYREAIKDFVVENPEDMQAVLDKKYDRVKMLEFRNKYISGNIDNCVKYMADFLIDIANEERNG